MSILQGTLEGPCIHFNTFYVKQINKYIYICIYLYRLELVHEVNEETRSQGFSTFRGELDSGERNKFSSTKKGANVSLEDHLLYKQGASSHVPCLLQGSVNKNHEDNA